MTPKKIKVLVTGGAGYLGAVLVGDLLRGGYQVTVVDSFAHNVDSLVNLATVTGIEVIRGDARDQSLMAPLLQRTDVFIPLAGLVGVTACDHDPATAVATNRDAVAWACSQLGLGQVLIFPSTCSVYGKADPSQVCTEETLPNPVSLYARCKLEAERIVMQRPSSVTLRLASGFGVSPRMRLDLLVNDFTYQAVHERLIMLFESSYKRDFIHVRDASQAFLHVLSNPQKFRGQIFNCGLVDTSLSKLEVCELLRLRLPDLTIVSASLSRDPDQRNYVISHEKFMKMDFRPRYSIEQGIDELIRFFTTTNVAAAS